MTSLQICRDAVQLPKKKPIESEFDLVDRITFGAVVLLVFTGIIGQVFI